MLKEVCCIIDVDGFSVKQPNPFHHQSYRHEFLVRELGYVKVDPAYEYLPRSFRFDLNGAYDFKNCTEEVERTLRYQSLKVTGLSVLPGPQETDALPYHQLPELIKSVYESCMRTDATVVAFKGGHNEADLLKGVVPCVVDLQSFGCPSYETILKDTWRKYKNCGHHRDIPGKVAHCPLAEVAAYRDWFMANVNKYSDDGDSRSTCTVASSDCNCANCYSSSD